jgi:uncharacterized protein YdeI (YjbR/CyaY-like superfamily)
MKITQTFTSPDRQTWHNWLAEHGASESEVWLVYFKASTGIPTISYEDSLEEALCFGWVDSLIQKIDEQIYARKFTPRKLGSQWSELNKHLVAKLVKEGRMTEAGLAKVEFPIEEAQAERPRAAPLSLPDWLAQALQSNPQAWANFQALPLTQRRRYVGWLGSAKREETRRQRLQKALGMLERNERIEMDSRLGGE